MPCRPVEGEQAAATHTFEHRLFGKPERAGQVIVKLVHGRQRNRRAVEVLHINVGDVKTFPEQRNVRLRFVAEKFRAPDPRGAGRGRFRAHEQRRASADGEVEPLVSVPTRLAAQATVRRAPRRIEIDQVAGKRPKRNLVDTE